jgi:hypothetical protein
MSPFGIMKHEASICGRPVGSDSRFIVYGPAAGGRGETSELGEAKRILDEKRRELRQWNAEVDLSIFRWSHGNWVPAISLYELQETDVEKNPSTAIDLV